ncbi:putative alpha-glucosidase [compost metagenome]
MPDYDFADQVELKLFQIKDGAVVSRKVRNVKGETELEVTVARTGSSLKVTATGAGKSFKVSLHGEQAASVEGATLGQDGVIEVASFKGSAELSITLK